MADPDLETFVGIGLHRLVIPSSFAAKISDVSLTTSQGTVTLSEFRLGAGAWIVQAKATVKALGGTINPDHPAEAEDEVRASLYLQASQHVPAGQKSALANDEAEAIYTNYRGATMMAIVGFDAPTPASVVLKARNDYSRLVNGKAAFSNIVITAIKQDELITLAI